MVMSNVRAISSTSSNCGLHSQLALSSLYRPMHSVYIAALSRTLIKEPLREDKWSGASGEDRVMRHEREVLECEQVLSGLCIEPCNAQQELHIKNAQDRLGIARAHLLLARGFCAKSKQQSNV